MDKPHSPINEKILYAQIQRGQSGAQLVKSWWPYNHIVKIGDINNQILDFNFFGLVMLSECGFSCDVSFYLHLVPKEPTQRALEEF